MRFLSWPLIYIQARQPGSALWCKDVSKSELGRKKQNAAAYFLDWSTACLRKEIEGKKTGGWRRVERQAIQCVHDSA